MHRLSILLAGLLLAASIFAAPAHAQLRVDGEPVRLTSSEQTFLGPEWSPDGSRIAASGDSYSGIYVIDVDDGEIEAITDEPGSGYGFSWSPTGEAILARVARFDGPRRTDALKVFDLENGTSEHLTDYRTDLSALPRWDETGSRVFLYANDQLEVVSLDADAALKTAETERPEWVASTSGLARISLAREEVRPASLIDNQVDNQTVLNVTASPDGARVAFEVLGGNLFVTNSDGTEVIDLGQGNRPSWSPDGEWIVYMRTKDDGHTFTESDLHAVRTDGSNPIRLTDTPGRLEMNPAWSPDGRRIAFNDFAEGTIFLLPVSR